MKKSFVVAGFLGSMVVFSTLANDNQAAADTLRTELTPMEQELAAEVEAYYNAVFTTTLEDLLKEVRKDVLIFNSMGELTYQKPNCCLNLERLPTGAEMLMIEEGTAYFLVR